MNRLPKVEDSFTTIDGPHGQFEIALRGRGREDPGWTYLYRDDKHKLVFLAAKTVGKVENVWDLHYENSEQPVRLSVDEERVIRDNIVYMFQNRHLFDPAEIVEPCDFIDSVHFKWSVIR